MGGPGIGQTALHQAKPLYDEGILEKVYATGIKNLPESLLFEVPDISAPYEVSDIYFDGYCALNMEKPDFIQSWVLHSLFQLREFPEATSVLNLFSAHMEEQAKILNSELGFYEINPMLVKKATRELELCDYIFVPSEWIYKSLESRGLEHKAKIVPFGVDLDKFHPRKMPREDDIFRVIYVGSNWIRKGLVYLIYAWQQLKLENAELIIAGVNDDVKNAFVNITSENIKWGWVPDLVETYQNSDVCVHPALEDGAPLSVTEAMACGVAPIITKNTGTTQHIYDGHNGFIVDIKSAEQIGERLQWMYDNRDHCRKMGREARKTVEAFPWERHEKEYVKWVKKL